MGSIPNHVALLFGATSLCSYATLARPVEQPFVVRMTFASFPSNEMHPTALCRRGPAPGSPLDLEIAQGRAAQELQSAAFMTSADRVLEAELSDSAIESRINDTTGGSPRHRTTLTTIRVLHSPLPDEGLNPSVSKDHVTR